MQTQTLYVYEIMYSYCALHSDYSIFCFELLINVIRLITLHTAVLSSAQYSYV